MGSVLWPSTSLRWSPFVWLSDSEIKFCTILSQNFVQYNSILYSSVHVIISGSIPRNDNMNRTIPVATHIWWWRVSHYDNWMISCYSCFVQPLRPIIPPAENLSLWHELSWLTWKSLNRLRIQDGWSKKICTGGDLLMTLPWSVNVVPHHKRWGTWYRVPRALSFVA